MKRKVLGICTCLLILALDIIAAVLAMKAKEAQNHVKHLRVWIFECKGKGKSHEAFVLGVAAAVLLSAAHLLANLLGFCSQGEPQKPSPPSKKFSKLFLVLTWIVYTVGVGMLVIGTRSNEKKGISCGFTYHNFLPTGAVLCGVHAVLSLAYYLTSTAALHTST